MRAIVLSLALLAGAGTSVVASPEADRKEFVRTYIRHITDFELARQKAESDLEPSPQAKIVGCVRNMTSFQIELNGQVDEIGRCKLDGELKDFPSLLQMTYRRKSELA